nr:hypothetical protein [Kiritimatiellia bacterium]
MMSTNTRLAKTAGAGVACALALVLHGDVQAADSEVPLAWNVSPMQAGAYREAFETAVPAWAAAVGFNVLSNDYPAMTGLPVRSNARFAAGSKVLQLETD